MQSRALLASFVLLLSACAPRTLAPVPVPVAAAPASTEVQILAINDFHGNLEPPKFGIDATAPEVAIVVPVYDAPEAVERCLDSVLQHTAGRAQRFPWAARRPRPFRHPIGRV